VGAVEVGWKNPRIMGAIRAMPDQAKNPEEPKLGILRHLTKRLDDLLVWIGAGGILWTVLSATTKNMTLLGKLGWADATILGALMTVFILVGLSASLAMYRFYRPLYSQKEEQKSIISGNRGLITAYYREGIDQTFRDYSEQQFLYVRRHLSKNFLISSMMPSRLALCILIKLFDSTWTKLTVWQISGRWHSLKHV
jgi:hypothetical protein